MTKKTKPKKLRLASVDEMMAEGMPQDIVEELYGEMGSIEDPPTPKKKTVTVRATRNFDQMVRGETIVVDPKETYWSDNLRGGNVEVVK